MGGLVVSPRLTWRLRIGKLWLDPNPFVKLRGRSPFRVLSHKFWPARNAFCSPVATYLIDDGGLITARDVYRMTSSGMLYAARIGS